MASTILASAGYHTPPRYFPLPTPSLTHDRGTRSLEIPLTNVETLNLTITQHFEATSKYHHTRDKWNSSHAQANCAPRDLLENLDGATLLRGRFNTSIMDLDALEAKESVLDETKQFLKPELERVKSNHHLLSVQYMHAASTASVARVTDVAVVGEPNFFEDENVLPPPLPRKRAIKRAKNIASKRPLPSPTAIVANDSEVAQSMEDSVTAQYCHAAHTNFSPDVEEQTISQRVMMVEHSLHAPFSAPNFVREEASLQKLMDQDETFGHDQELSSVSSDSGTSTSSFSSLTSPSVSPCYAPNSPPVVTKTSAQPINNLFHPSTIDDMTALNMDVVVTSVQNVSLSHNDSLVRILPNTAPNSSESSSGVKSVDVSDATPLYSCSSHPHLKDTSRQPNSPVSVVPSLGFTRLPTQLGGSADSFIKCVSPLPYKQSPPVSAPSNTSEDFVLSAPPVRPTRHIYRTRSNASPTSVPRFPPSRPYKGTRNGSNLPLRNNESSCLPPPASTVTATKPTSRLNGLVVTSLPPKVKKQSLSRKEPLPPSNASSAPGGPPKSKNRLPGSLNMLSPKFLFQRSNTFHLSSGFFSRQKSRRVEAQNPSSRSGGIVNGSQRAHMNSPAVQESIANRTRNSPIQLGFDSSYKKSKSYPQESVKREHFASDDRHPFHAPLTRQIVKRSSDAVNRRKVLIAEHLYEGGDGSDEPEFSYVPESVQQLTLQAGSAGGPSPATPAASSPLHLKESIDLLQDGLAFGSLVGKFENLCRRKQSLLMDVAKLPRNESRNRYRDISPYDTTRVILLNTDLPTPPTTTTVAGASLNNDYINASHVVMEIPGSNITNSYIACQGPLNSTCGHFWQMVWEQQSTLLVMLTTCIEQGRSKCHQYWPEVNSSTDYGNVTVSCDQQKLQSGYAVRELTVTHRKGGEKRQLQHLQYLSWPDHGVPEQSTEFLAFVKQVRDIRAAGASAHPTIVHCSAGIGRTGVLVLMETAQCLIEAQQPVYPVDLVQIMRDQRAMMIQTSGQFRFVCEAICRVYNEKLVEPLSKYSNR